MTGGRTVTRGVHHEQPSVSRMRKKPQVRSGACWAVTDAVFDESRLEPPHVSVPPSTQLVYDRRPDQRTTR